MKISRNPGVTRTQRREQRGLRMGLTSTNSVSTSKTKEPSIPNLGRILKQSLEAATQWPLPWLETLACSQITKHVTTQFVSHRITSKTASPDGDHSPRSNGTHMCTLLDEQQMPIEPQSSWKERYRYHGSFWSSIQTVIQGLRRKSSRETKKEREEETKGLRWARVTRFRALYPSNLPLCKHEDQQ